VGLILLQRSSLEFVSRTCKTIHGLTSSDDIVGEDNFHSLIKVDSDVTWTDVWQAHYIEERSGSSGLIEVTVNVRLSQGDEVLIITLGES
jgi:hypothetical protein